MPFDFLHFQQQLTQATQDAFRELLAAHHAEGLYSFALYSDEGALTVCPSANSLAHLAAQPPEDQLYAKFEPAEWAYEMRGAENQFKELSRQLRTHVLEEDLPAEVFEQFRQQLYATCVAVLDELREQRFLTRRRAAKCCSCSAYRTATRRPPSWRSSLANSTTMPTAPTTWPGWPAGKRKAPLPPP